MKLRNKKTIRKIKGYRQILSIGILSIGLLFVLTISLAFYNKTKQPLFLAPTPLERLTTVLTGKTYDAKYAVEDLLKKNNIALKEIQENKSMIQLTLVTQEEILLSKNKALDTQIASLQVILNRLTMEGKRIKRLDLRFDKPVIVFQ